MTARAIVINDAGTILRTVSGSPAMLGLQAGDGEYAFALIDDDGGRVDDAKVIVSEAGEWALAEGAPEGVSVPSFGLGYIAP